LEGPTKSAEDYLACILELLEQKGYARIADVARHRSVAEASASTMIKRLATQGYLNHENYRGFTLTDTGRTIAIEVHSRRKILTRFLRSLGLPQNVITHDVDGLGTLRQPRDRGTIERRQHGADLSGWSKHRIRSRAFSHCFHVTSFIVE
jgi:Mn-dependent DtxR family transcriptional regulator